MGASQSQAKLDQSITIALNNTLTSGITKVDPSKAICDLLSFSVRDGVAKVYLRVNALKKNIAADAALGFGEKLFSYPAGLGLVQPLFTHYSLVGSCPTGLSATAGEVGLGSTIASGAVAVLTGTAGFHDVAEAQTIANHVAATPLAIKEIAPPDVPFAGGQTIPAMIRDASASAVAVHLNIASTFNQTAAEDYTFSGTLVHSFKVLGKNFGVE